MPLGHITRTPDGNYSQNTSRLPRPAQPHGLRECASTIPLVRCACVVRGHGARQVQHRLRRRGPPHGEPKRETHSEIRDDILLRDQVDLDSMDWVNFLRGIHRRLHVDIPEEDYASLRTLADVVGYVEKNAPNPRN
jgi:acyl carrier protein